jgi:hypothetical protein
LWAFYTHPKSIMGQAIYACPIKLRKNALL